MVSLFHASKTKGSDRAKIIFFSMIILRRWDFGEFDITVLSRAPDHAVVYLVSWKLGSVDVS